MEKGRDKSNCIRLVSLIQLSFFTGHNPKVDKWEVMVILTKGGGGLLRDWVGGGDMNTNLLHHQQTARRGN